jgi:kinetochore protein Mis12/MTW1
LGHYEGLSFAFGEGEGEAPDGKSVALQRRKLRETQKLGVLLKMEKERNEATIASLRRLILGEGVKREEDADVEMDGESKEFEEGYPTFAFLQDKGELAGDGDTPITTTTSFALSQVPALHSLLKDLQPRLQELANGNGKDGMVGEEEKSFRKKRLEFIEKETRRHLEQVRGLELGEQGAVRDGEWQGEGRTLAKGEVESLERIVEMIGGAPRGDPMDTGS